MLPQERGLLMNQCKIICYVITVICPQLFIICLFVCLQKCNKIAYKRLIKTTAIKDLSCPL